MNVNKLKKDCLSWSVGVGTYSSINIAGSWKGSPIVQFTLVTYYFTL